MRALRTAVVLGAAAAYAPGFPPLPRSIERTEVSGTGTRTMTCLCTDWVVDGRPVRGTESGAK